MANDSKLKQATYILHSDGNPTDNILCIDEGGAGGYEYFKLQKNKDNRRFIYEDVNGRAEYEDSVITEKIRQDLDNEIVRAKQEEARIESKLDAEIARSVSVDNDHETRITNNHNQITTNTNSLNTLSTRVTDNYNQLMTLHAEEVETRKNKDIELEANINANYTELRNDIDNLATANGLLSTQTMTVQFNNPAGSGQPTDWLRSVTPLTVSSNYNYYVLNAESLVGTHPVGRKLSNVTATQNGTSLVFYASLTENVNAIDNVDITFTLLKLKKRV